MKSEVPFSTPWLNGNEVESVSRALQLGGIAGQGPSTSLVEERVGTLQGVSNVVFTNSGSSALLIALLSFGLRPGDKVVVPSFGFVALPQAVLLAGGEPFFVDVDPETGSMLPDSLRLLDSPNIRGLIVIHYGGISADMEKLLDIAHDRGWFLLEDAAHGFTGRHKLGPLGSLGSAGVLSFDHQKNVQCGEGGAVILNDPDRAAKARAISALGTNRHDGSSGATLDFDWVEKGIKGYPPDYVAAMLLSQLDSVEFIQKVRHIQWQLYNSRLREWAESLGILQPRVDVYATLATWHIFWLTFSTEHDATSFIDWMAERGVECKRHYSSLASLSMGAGFDRVATPGSSRLAECLVRLPLGPQLTESQVEQVIVSALEWVPARLGTISS